MLNKAKKIFGILWALPITFLMFLYVTPFWISGDYAYIGWNGISWLWLFRPQDKRSRFRDFLEKSWGNKRARSAGNIVIIKAHRPGKWSKIIEQHEIAHVNQAMMFGIFYPFFYFLFWLLAKLVFKNAHPIYDNLFEIDARRFAGQIVDVQGTIQKIERLTKEK